MHKFSIPFRLGIFTATLFCSLPLISFAEEEQPAAGTTLQSLISEALSNNRDLAAVLETWEAAEYRAPQASALPNPTASLAIMGKDRETMLGPEKNIYEFEQMIPFPGKLSKKRQIAKAEAGAVKAQFYKTKLDVILKISEVYHDLFATDAILKTAEETRDLLQKMEAIAQNRYASQSGSQRDVAKAQAAVSEILERTFILRQQRATLEALMNSLLNRKNSGAVENLTPPGLPTLSKSLDELLALAKENRPEIKEASAFLNRDRLSLDLSKYENAPDFSVGFQYTEIGDGTTSDPNDGRDAWMIPLKVTIPLWQNRIGAGISEAKRNLNAAQAKFDQSENTSEFEVKDTYYRFTSSKQVVELYENALLPEVELAFRSDQAGYEAGTVDILNFLDSERIFLNAKVAYAQARAEALKNFARLERAVGTSLISLEGVAP